jgi:hypothetical protein
MRREGRWGKKRKEKKNGKRRSIFPDMINKCKNYPIM